MKLKIEIVRVLIVLVFGIGITHGFSSPKLAASRTRTPAVRMNLDSSPLAGGPALGRAGFLRRAAASAAAAAAAAGGGAALLAGPGAARADDTVDDPTSGEVAKEELPPMWVPLATGAVLFVGIGVLQASLGDVMEAEAGLGSASGARARKENTRRKKFLD